MIDILGDNCSKGKYQFWRVDFFDQLLVIYNGMGGDNAGLLTHPPGYKPGKKEKNVIFHLDSDYLRKDERQDT